MLHYLYIVCKPTAAKKLKDEICVNIIFNYET